MRIPSVPILKRQRPGWFPVFRPSPCSVAWLVA